MVYVYVVLIFGLVWAVLPKSAWAEPASAVVSPVDGYEPDDTCASAIEIQTDGMPQAHNFHRNGDEDWTRFQVVSGTVYALQTINAQYRAHPQIALVTGCDQPVLQVDHNPFGLDARITWRANYSGTAYLNISNVPPTVFDEGTGYEVSVRASEVQPIAIIVAGTRGISGTQQTKIDAAADMAYRTLLSVGVPKANVHYLGSDPQRDVDGNKQIDDISGQISLESVSDAIQVWTHARNLTSGVPLYLYFVGPSMPDGLFVGGTTMSQTLTSEMLSSWLSGLEYTAGLSSTTIIVDASFAGSFITATDALSDTLSAPGRVIVTSSSSTGNAYSSADGMRFSEMFWTAMGQSQSVKTAFDRARQALNVVGLAQMPWLDDNADQQVDSSDGRVAYGRGLMTLNISRPPVIDFVSSGVVRDGHSDLVVQVRDDFAVAQVRAEIYSPQFVEPAPVISTSLPTLPILTQVLARQADSNLHAATLTNLIWSGCYRVAVFAQDFEQNSAIPQVALICVPWRVWLPLASANH